MKRKIMPFLLAFLSGCGSLNLVVVNATDKPIKQVEIRAGDFSKTVPVIEPGAAHAEVLKVGKASEVSVNYLDVLGHQYFTSSPQSLKAGETGLLKLSVTAKGALDAEFKK